VDVSGDFIATSKERFRSSAMAVLIEAETA
jgi:hypothetical protein